MNDFEIWCRTELSKINTTLVRLDESIRGNGKLGIVVRLDRVEGVIGRQAKFLWIGLGIVFSIGVEMVWAIAIG